MTGEILATLPDGSVATRDRIDWCTNETAAVVEQS